MRYYSTTKNLMMIIFMLFISINIMAEDGLITEQITITLDEPGTLGSKIGFKKKNLITNLKIKGALNIDDIKFVREMAGCYYSKNAHYNGNLSHLDLEDAWFIDSNDKNIKVYDETGFEFTLSLQEPCVARFQFCYLTSLRSIVLPSYITSIENCGFSGCDNLYSVTTPSTLTKIGDNAFQYCKSLSSINLPEGLTYIGANAFGGYCTSLQSIYLPRSLKKIDIGAFNMCSGLKFVYTYNPQPLTFEYDPFCPGSNPDQDWRRKATLYVPKGSKQSYTNAKYWREFKNIVEFDPTPVLSISVTKKVNEVSRYSINGMHLDCPSTGMNIVKYSDGTVKKVMVK